MGIAGYFLNFSFNFIDTCSFAETEENVFRFKDLLPVPDGISDYTDALRNDKAAIIIDNGMWRSDRGIPQ